MSKHKKHTHMVDKSNKGFTVCGLAVTNKRPLVNVKKFVTCHKCGLEGGVEYWDSAELFIQASYPDVTSYVFQTTLDIVPSGCKKESKVFVFLIKKNDKVKSCIKVARGWRLTDENETTQVRITYNTFCEERDKQEIEDLIKKDERIDRLKKLERDAAKAEEKELSELNKERTIQIKSLISRGKLDDEQITRLELDHGIKYK